MITVSFGTLGIGDGHDHLRAVLGDAAGSYFLPTIKPVMFCRNISGMPRWQHSSMKCAPFLRALGEQDAVVGDDRRRDSRTAGKAADQGGAIELLELIEFRAIDEAGDHFAHVIGLLGSRRDTPYSSSAAYRGRLGAR